MGSQSRFPSKSKEGKHQKQWNNKKKKGNRGDGFKGSISEMNGNVFQCHGETNVSNQFNRTMEALKTYVASKFNDNIQVYLRHVIKYLEMPKIKKPDNPSNEKDPFEMEIWKREVDAYVKSKDLLHNSMGKLYVTVWSQCSEAMRSKVRGTSAYTDMDKDLDVIKLLKTIKGVSMHFDNQTYIPKSIDDAKKLFYSLKEGEHEKHPSFLKRFSNLVEVIEHYGGELGADPILLQLEQDFLSKQGRWPPPSIIVKQEGEVTTRQDLHQQFEYERNILKKSARDRYLAIAFVNRCDQDRVGEYATELHNAYINGDDRNPVNLTNAYNAVINYKPRTRKRNKSFKQNRDDKGKGRNEDDDPRDLADSGDDDVVTDDINMNTVGKGKKSCWVCGKEDHMMQDCPKKKAWDEFMKKKENANSNVQMAIMDQGEDSESDDDDNDDVFDGGMGNLMCMHIQESPKNEQLVTPTQAMIQNMNEKGVKVNNRWLILDSASTVTLIMNPNLVSNIRRCKEGEELRAYCNGGYQDTTMIADMAGYGTVWYNPNSLANII